MEKSSLKKGKDKNIEATVSTANTVLQKDIDLLASTVNPEIELLRNQCKELQEQLALYKRTLMFQEYIPGPPMPKEQLYAKACSNDGITVTSWIDQWISQLEANNAKYNFVENSVMQEYGKNSLKPCIIAGSGPSLRKNIKDLVGREGHPESGRGDIPIVSCLHNFAYFEDNGVHAEYYINLDAGDITIGEMAQGGKHDEEYYWNLTKDRTLISVVTAHPKILEKWQGKILFYGVIVPEQSYMDKYKAITPFNVMFNVGGNSLGACLYMAKAILGSNPVAFIGADFCFGYDKQFHPFKSPYDEKFAGLMPCTDIFGNRVFTWPSYFNFKNWFDYMAMGGKGGNPGMYINCTEGGILGAYPEGNIRHIQQWTLAEFLFAYNAHKMMPAMIDHKERYSLLF